VVTLAILLVIAGLLALDRSQRLAPWFLAVGGPLAGGLWLLGRLRVPWPDVGLWTVYVLNPYLLVPLSSVLVAADVLGTLRAASLLDLQRPEVRGDKAFQPQPLAS
jgi:hypothetical protein